MATLRDQLGHGDKRAAIIKDANDVLEMEVQDKGGLTGVAIRGAFAIVKGVKPGFTTEVIDHLLNDFLDALDPIYQEAVAQGKRPGVHLAGNRDRMAEALLAITDARAERASRGVIKKTYDKLRPSAKKHVGDAAPRVGELLDRHTTA
ncbi:MAG: hypothetical protein ABW217_23720 [Polyangiaceae bacterium]